MEITTQKQTKIADLSLENLDLAKRQAELTASQEIKSFESVEDLARYLLRLFGQDSQKIELYLKTFENDLKDQSSKYTKNVEEGLGRFAVYSGGNANLRGKKPKFDGYIDDVSYPNNLLFIVNRKIGETEIRQIEALFQNTQLIPWLVDNLQTNTRLTKVTISLLRVCFNIYKFHSDQSTKNLNIWDEFLNSRYDLIDSQSKYIVYELLDDSLNLPESITELLTDEVKDTLNNARQKNLSLYAVLNDLGENGTVIRDYVDDKYQKYLKNYWFENAEDLPNRQLFGEEKDFRKITHESQLNTEYCEFVQENKEQKDQAELTPQESSPQIPQDILELFEEVKKIIFTPEIKLNWRQIASNDSKNHRLDALTRAEHEQRTVTTLNILEKQKLTGLLSSLIAKVEELTTKKPDVSNIDFSNIELTDEQESWITRTVGKNRIVNKAVDVFKQFVYGYLSYLDIGEPMLFNGRLTNYRIDWYSGKVSKDEVSVTEDEENLDFVTVAYRFISKFYQPRKGENKHVKVNMMLPENSFKPFTKDPFVPEDSKRWDYLTKGEKAEYIQFLDVFMTTSILNILITMNLGVGYSLFRYLFCCFINLLIPALSSAISFWLDINSRYKEANDSNPQALNTPIYELVDNLPLVAVNKSGNKFADPYFNNLSEGSNKTKLLILFFNVAVSLVLVPISHDIIITQAVPRGLSINQKEAPKLLPNIAPSTKTIIAETMQGKSEPLVAQVLINDIRADEQIPEISSSMQTDISTKASGEFNPDTWKDSKYTITKYPFVQPGSTIYLPQGQRVQQVFANRVENLKNIAVSETVSTLNYKGRLQLRDVIVVSAKRYQTLPSSNLSLAKDIKLPQGLIDPTFSVKTWSETITDEEVAQKITDIHQRFLKKEITDEQVLEELDFISKYEYAFNGLKTYKNNLRYVMVNIANNMKQHGIVCNQANTATGLIYSEITKILLG